jgi:hypothetical protein
LKQNRHLFVSKVNHDYRPRFACGLSPACRVLRCIDSLALRVEPATKAAQEAGSVFPRQLVLPDPQHPPTLAPQGAGDEAVAGQVGGELSPPKRGVAPRQPAVERAPVPETPIDEHRDAEPGKNEIWLAEDRPMPPPARDALRAQDADLPISPNSSKRWTPPPASNPTW